MVNSTRLLYPCAHVAKTDQTWVLPGYTKLVPAVASPHELGLAVLNEVQKYVKIVESSVHIFLPNSPDQLQQVVQAREHVDLVEEENYSVRQSQTVGDW